MTTRVEVQGWVVEVDPEASAAFIERYGEDCDCGHCRNFREVLPQTYPDLCDVLRACGLDPQRPVESYLSNREPDGRYRYGAVWYFCGRVVTAGRVEHAEVLKDVKTWQVWFKAGMSMFELPDPPDPVCSLDMAVLLPSAHGELEPSSAKRWPWYRRLAAFAALVGIVILSPLLALWFFVSWPYRAWRRRAGKDAPPAG